MFLNVDLPVFPVQHALMPPIKKCVTLSRKIDQRLHTTERKKANQRWVHTQSAAMDMDPEEELLSDEEEVARRHADARQSVAEWTEQLNQQLDKWHVPKVYKFTFRLHARVVCTRAHSCAFKQRPMNS